MAIITLNRGSLPSVRSISTFGADELIETFGTFYRERALNLPAFETHGRGHIVTPTYVGNRRCIPFSVNAVERRSTAVGAFGIEA